MTRGFDNNNPGNIRISDAHWMGKVYPSKDPEFETFDTPENGIRALAKILLTYYTHLHLNTVEEIISRWAPSSENNTAAYVADVADRMMVKPDTPLNLTDPQTLFAMTGAIIHHENGSCPYDTAQIMDGIDKALEIVDAAPIQA